MSKIYVGIDNGTSGTIGIIGLAGGPVQFTPPTKLEQNYTKTVQNITRIDYPAFRAQLADVVKAASVQCAQIHVILERPFVNPGMFKTSIHAVRAFEAELIAIESFELSYEFADSKVWQKALLPAGLKGSKSLKKASMDIGLRLFPQLTAQIKKHGDADGLLIAQWARQANR